MTITATLEVRSAHPAPDCFTKAQAFFWEHAGYNWNAAAGEPELAGKARCAMELAEAEAVYLDAHRKADVVCLWDMDVDGMNERERGSNVELVEIAAISVRNADGDDAGECLASCCGIEDATPDYRRVMRAELAIECIDKLRAIAEGA